MAVVFTSIYKIQDELLVFAMRFDIIELSLSLHPTDKKKLRYIKKQTKKTPYTVTFLLFLNNNTVCKQNIYTKLIEIFRLIA